jgi:hypothetical protein
MVTTLIVTLLILPMVYRLIASKKYITPEQEDELP